ncbi:MAG: TetR/AcrR family transcriptional regulator [Sulfitobacter sp.]|nr:TetR/AcrR family transcriptional regulator [Sulfitobacter sp.]
MAELHTKAPYHHGNLRAQLIESVRELVESHGPDGFSVSQASRKAGVSSAAPYKHFRDKPHILHHVALEGMRRLGDQMRAARDDPTARHPSGIDTIGQAYINFARAEPGVFRLMFGLTNDHDELELKQAGEQTYGVLVDKVAEFLGRDFNDLVTQKRSYMLWTFVHGHAFLEIDKKTGTLKEHINERDYFLEITQKFLSD